MTKVVYRGHNANKGFTIQASRYSPLPPRRFWGDSVRLSPIVASTSDLQKTPNQKILVSLLVAVTYMGLSPSSQAKPAAGNTQYKIKQNLTKIELTVSYLALHESDRFHDTIVVTSKTGQLRSRTKIAMAGIFWIEENNTFMIVFTEDTLKNSSQRWLQFLSAHEVCHAIIHNERIKRNEIVDNPKDDRDADFCALDLLYRHKSAIAQIWKK